MADKKNAYEKSDARHLPSAEDFHLPLCQPVNHMVSLEKEGCPTCHLVETSICSGHCVTKVLWMAQPRQEGQGVNTMLVGGYLADFTIG